MKTVTAALAGLLFAVGLGLAGMTDPSNIVGFLDFTGAWNPSLAFVMGGALMVHGLTRLVVLKRQQPIFGASFPDTSNRQINRPLLLGSAIFGIGWALGGFCPGPGLAAMASGPAALVFVGTMLLGFRAAERWPIRDGSSTEASKQA